MFVMVADMIGAFCHLFHRLWTQELLDELLALQRGGVPGNRRREVAN